MAKYILLGVLGWVLSGITYNSESGIIKREGGFNLINRKVIVIKPEEKQKAL